MTCSICKTGALRRVRGRVICSDCLRRTCHRCQEPILRTQSMHETGIGCAHLNGCPGSPAERGRRIGRP
jgi:hypothetical protein